MFVISLPLVGWGWRDQYIQSTRKIYVDQLLPLGCRESGGLFPNTLFCLEFDDIWIYTEKSCMATHTSHGWDVGAGVNLHKYFFAMD